MSKNSKKGKVFLIILLVLVLLGGGVAASYLFWYKKRIDRRFANPICPGKYVNLRHVFHDKAACLYRSLEQSVFRCCILQSPVRSHHK